MKNMDKRLTKKEKKRKSQKKSPIFLMNSEHNVLEDNGHITAEVSIKLPGDSENKKNDDTNGGSSKKKNNYNSKSKFEKPSNCSNSHEWDTAQMDDSVVHSRNHSENKKTEDTNRGSSKLKEKSRSKSKFVGKVKRSNNLSGSHQHHPFQNDDSVVHSRNHSEIKKTRDSNEGSSKQEEISDNKSKFDSNNHPDSYQQDSFQNDNNSEVYSRNRKYENDYYRNDIPDFHRSHNSYHPNSFRWNNMPYPNQTSKYNPYNFRNDGWGSWQQNHRDQSMYGHRNRVHPPFNKHSRDGPDDFESPGIQMRRVHQQAYTRWDEDYVHDGTSFVSENIQPEMSENVPVFDDSFNHPNSSSPVIEKHFVNQEAVRNEKSTTDLDKTVTMKVLPEQSGKKHKVICGIAKTAIKRTSIDKKTDSENPTDSANNDKRNVLSENMTGKRIAHWINPSNQKDAAEVRRLVTEFSKSKKKENLLRLKLQQSAEECSDDKSNRNKEICENNSDITSEIPTSETSEANKSSIGLPFSPQKEPELVLNVDTMTLTSIGLGQKRAKSSTIKSPTELKSLAKKPRSRNVNKTVHSDKETTIQITPFSENPRSESIRKRKDYVENVNPNFKRQRHRCSSAECLEACIEATVQAGNLLQPAATSVSKEPSSQSVLLKESTSQEKFPGVKQELSETLVSDDMATQNFLESINLGDLLQEHSKSENFGSEEATMTPVESLINLFATGDVKVKKEFDDPLIDAIRTVDPAILDKVCSVSSTTNEDITRPNEPNFPVISKVQSIAPSQSPANHIPFLTESLKNTINELQSISTSEEKVKKNLEEADKKINEYQTLLEDWKTKKIKFQSEEEVLRKQRNILVKSMNDLVTQQNGIYPGTESLENSDHNSPLTMSSPVVSCGEASVKKEVVDDDDEIAILPLPDKSSDSKFPVIEIDEGEARDKVYKEKMNQLHLKRFSDHKDIQAHETVINYLQIFEEYLYSCSNDFTAKRFSLKDPTISMTYKVNAKNVTHMCIEKVRGKTVVFVSSATLKTVTAFDAEFGTVLQVFNLKSVVSCICNNRGKIYAGLRNGSIIVLNWKEQKELVNTTEPVRSLTTINQGGLNLLVILSTKGHVSMRDVDRSGLLIRCVKSRTHVPLFMTVHSDFIYLSSSGVLTVLDISTGKFVRKYELSAAYTNLAVSGNNIFTTSFSGLVRCYSKDEVKDVKLYYGAGKASLTCIHVHQGWVFTGNRKGQLAAFKFDPDSGISCQFEMCEFIFPRLEDLLHHVLVAGDHTLPTTGSLCTWRTCSVIIPNNWDAEAIKCHVKEHLTGRFPQSHHQLYNFYS